MAGATCCDHEHVQSLKAAVAETLTPGGWLDQGRAAAAKGGGAFLAFIQQLLATLGPLIGPLIAALISGLIPHLPAPPAPTPAPAAK